MEGIKENDLMIESLNQFFGLAEGVGGTVGVPSSSHSLNTFRSELDRNGTALTNRFEVRFNPPAGFALNADLNRSMSLRVQTVTLPGVNLTTSDDSNIYGPTRQVVDGVTFAENMQMTLIDSSSLGARRYFESWQQLAYNPTTWNVGYYNEYTGTVDIFVLNNDGQPTYGVRLWEAFPKTVQGLPLQQAPTIVETAIDLTFRYWSNIAQWGAAPPATKLVSNDPNRRTPASHTMVSNDPNRSLPSAARARQAEAFRAGEARRAGFNQPAGVSGTRFVPNTPTDREVLENRDMPLHLRQSAGRRMIQQGRLNMSNASKRSLMDKFRTGGVTER